MTATKRGWLVLSAALALSASVFALPSDPAARDIDLIERLGKEPGPDQSAVKPNQLEVRDAARTIDGYLTAYYEKAGVKPNRRASDDLFLRRVYLDIAGRIPTLEETLAFMKDASAHKRANIIDKLLAGDGYASHNFNYWADILRVLTNMQGGGQQYADYIRDALGQNKPFDQLAYELLTAEGYSWENGATGFYLRDDGMPLDNMALAVKTFMGTSLVCAQCHDHPFDLWTQREFYEMAAFTYNVETRVRPDNVRKAQEMAKDPIVRRALDDITRPLTYGVRETRRALKLPHDYKYDDAKPFDPVAPRAVFNGNIRPDQQQSLREAYARWITARDNPRFTTVIVNRMWAKVYGAPLITPIDEMTTDSKPVMPELVAFLEFKMRQFNYDLKQFQRMLFNTELYQRGTIVDDLVEGDEYHFQGPVLTRMTAEQLWDSLMTLIVPEIDQRPGRNDGDAYAMRQRMLQAAPPEALLEMAQARAEYEKQQTEIQDEIAKAREAKQEDRVRSLQRRLRDLRQAADRQLMTMQDGMMAKMDMKDYESDGPQNNDARWAGYPADFVRASELRSPENATHFLRLFGQSDREVPDNANKEPNMLQVLAMFNGGMFDRVMDDNSALMKQVNSFKHPADKLNVIFLSIYNRRPTNYEKDVVFKAITTSDGSHAWGRIVWALLNTREFSFVQ